MIRTFIALPLPLEIQSALGEVSRQLAPQSQGVKWVKPEHIHLTLRFLGDTDPEKVSALGAGLGQIACQHPPFPLRLGNCGAFPNLRRPRVLWVGLGESDALLKLRKAVEHFARSLGWERDAQEFKPHLTLGRAREGGSVPQEVPAVPPLEFQADKLELIESRLRPEDPEYLTLYRAPLKPD